MIHVILITLLSLITVDAESRIRLRKVKEPPKTCAVMKEDGLLSRPTKPIWSTEKHSVVVGEEITLLNDLGVKVCSWNKSNFSGLGDVASFRFYVDEYKEYIYPFIDRKELGYTMLKVPFKNCSLKEQVTLAKLDFPVCEKPKKSSKKRRKKVAKT